MAVHLMMVRVGLDNMDYPEVISFKAFRRCSSLLDCRGLFGLCLGEDFDCRVISLIQSSLEHLEY